MFVSGIPEEVLRLVTLTMVCEARCVCLASGGKRISRD